jgi:hypothetical protein
METLVTSLLLLVSATVALCVNRDAQKAPRVLAPAGIVGLEKTASAAAENNSGPQKRCFASRGNLRIAVAFTLSLYKAVWLKIASDRDIPSRATITGRSAGES